MSTYGRLRLSTQNFALTRLAASAWGCSLARAREIYTKVIRGAVAYGASAFHTPTTEGKPKGATRGLMAAQTRCLRTIAGAYKATPVRSLETETWVPPLDLYLNTRVARFEKRLQGSRMGELIRQSGATVARALRQRRRRPPRPPKGKYRDAATLAAWAAQWAPEDTSLEMAAEQAWRRRWQKEYDEATRQRPRRHKEAADEPLFTEEAVRRHDGLCKVESSVLVQARTGKIGLRDFLFQRRVPDAITPLCSCPRAERETVEHLVLRCGNVSEQQRAWLQERAQPLHTSSDFATALQSPERAKLIARWILGTGRLGKYRLAVEIMSEERQRDGAWNSRRSGGGAAVQDI